MLTTSSLEQHAGFVNDKAVAISAEGDKGVSFQSKKAKSVHQPAKAGHKTSFAGHNRKYVETIQSFCGHKLAI